MPNTLEQKSKNIQLNNSEELNLNQYVLLMLDPLIKKLR